MYKGFVSACLDQDMSKFKVTSRGLRTLYDSTQQPEFITVRRLDLEACIRATIGETICAVVTFQHLRVTALEKAGGLAN